MKTIWSCCVSFLLLATGGCAVSLQPLWSPDRAATDDRIVGTWRPFEPLFKSYEPTAWSIERANDGEYKVTVTSGRAGDSRAYRGRLARLGEATFLELCRSAALDPDSVPVHHIIRVQVDGDTLAFAELNAEKLKTVATRNKVKLAWETVGRTTVLTSPTAELQQFLLRHGSDVFDAPRIARRGEAVDPEEKKGKRDFDTPVLPLGVSVKHRLNMGEFAWVRSAAFSPDGRSLAVACGQDGAPGEIRLFSERTGKLVTALNGHKSQAYHVAFTPCGRLLVSAG